MNAINGRCGSRRRAGDERGKLPESGGRTVRRADVSFGGQWPLALYVPGQPCSVCGETIESADSLILLPRFTSNEVDPLYVLSDAAAHAHCIRDHPESTRLKERLDEFERVRSQPVKYCAVCGTPIADPSDYYGLGYLGNDDVARTWNYMMFHRWCLPKWHQLRALIAWTDWAVAHGVWTSHGILPFADELRTLHSQSDRGRVV